MERARDSFPQYWGDIPEADVFAPGHLILLQDPTRSVTITVDHGIGGAGRRTLLAEIRLRSALAGETVRWSLRDPDLNDTLDSLPRWARGTISLCESLRTAGFSINPFDAFFSSNLPPRWGLGFFESQMAASWLLIHQLFNCSLKDLKKIHENSNLDEDCRGIMAILLGRRQTALLHHTNNPSKQEIPFDERDTTLVVIPTGWKGSEDPVTTPLFDEALHSLQHQGPIALATFLRNTRENLTDQSIIEECHQPIDQLIALALQEPQAKGLIPTQHGKGLAILTHRSEAKTLKKRIKNRYHQVTGLGKRRGVLLETGEHFPRISS
jgi:hypothetical protein